MQYDYGDRSRPESYEYINFYDGLKKAGHEVYFFDYMEEISLGGRSKMNANLLECAAAFKPDLALISLYTDQIDPDTVLALKGITKTLCFFHDDMWRREFSLNWAPRFDYFTSSDFEAERKYKSAGLDHIIHFPFGVNESRYIPLPVEKKYDVSFVGQWHPYREWLINKLRKSGVKVSVFGNGWPSGPLSHEDMVKVFNESKINLNLSNSTSWDIRYLISSPRGILDRIRSKKDVEQIKARHFEISACNAFQLSYYVEGLERCYRIADEIGIFISPDDLVEKVRYYLSDEKLMTQIANSAYERTLDEHTYLKRFSKVFQKMGFSREMANP